jgi:hypothetical protein
MAMATLLVETLSEKNTPLGVESSSPRGPSSQVISKQALGVLGLVAIDAEVLPVAAVARIVVVVAVLVVDGQQVEVLLVELARAARADPAVKRE